MRLPWHYYLLCFQIKYISSARRYLSHTWFILLFMETLLQVGKPVYGNDMIGREEEIKLVEQLALHGQSVVLIATGRFGKTSILLEILGRSV